jgi:HPt (histidine-containing phosphotransfer) domain-containing protein
MNDYLSKPVRMLELRTALELRGGVGGNENGTPALASPTTAAPAGAVRPEEPLVDLDRLSEISNDDRAKMRQLADLYLAQADATRQSLDAAIKAGSAKETNLLAHRWSGASATCGILCLLAPLRQLELEAKQGQLSGASELLAQASRELEAVRGWLAAYFAGERGKEGGPHL